MATAARSRPRHDDGTPTKGDTARHRADAARADKARQRAYNEGLEAGRKSKVHQRRADDGDAQAHGHAAPQYHEGYSAGRTQANRQRLSTVSAKPLDMAHEASGFVLGLLAWAVFINYARGGTDGVKAWLRAKFFNEVAGTPPTPPTTKLAPGSRTDPHNIHGGVIA